MEEITNTCFSATTAQPRAKQPRPFVLALILTGLLYFGVKPSQPSKADVTFSSIAQPTNSVSQPVANAVLQDLSIRSRLPKSAFKIIKAQSLTSLEDCMSLSNTKRLCTQALVPGWHITVANGSRRWFYYTNKTGSIVQLGTKISSPSKEVKGDAIAINSRF
jgi:hypothetical protein